MMMRAIFVAIGVLVFSSIAAAETRLFVPQFRHGVNEDTQFLASNASDRDATLDLWAFTSAGELLGQVQLAVRAHGTRALTLSEAFGLGGQEVTGWIGAVSSSDDIQLSYTRISETTESFEAREWISRETRLPIHSLSSDVMRVSNPNAFAASFTVRSYDPAGMFLGLYEMTVGAFEQVEVPVSSVAHARAAQLDVISGSDLIAGIDGGKAERRVTEPNLGQTEENELDLVIDSVESLGAYQVTLSFDPDLVQFSPKDVLGGWTDGFESKPLVVNIDNIEGLMTLGTLQVGEEPAGRLVVARLRVVRRAGSAPRFGIHVDEISNTRGDSMALDDIAVGLIRAR